MTVIPLTTPALASELLGSADGGGGRVNLVMSKAVSPKSRLACAIGNANFIGRRRTKMI